MTVQELFKKLVRDAQAKFDPEAKIRPIMTYGSQKPSDFQSKTKTPGRFAHLTDENIDTLPDSQLEQELVMFIYKCFQQR